MEEQIKQLVELANEYRDTFINIIPLRKWTTLIKGSGLQLYFADTYDQWAIEFVNHVQISAYSSQIELPLDITSEKLQQIYDTAKDQLQDLKSNRMEILKKEAELERMRRVNELKEQLKQLEK